MEPVYEPHKMLVQCWNQVLMFTWIPPMFHQLSYPCIPCFTFEQAALVPTWVPETIELQEWWHSLRVYSRCVEWELYLVSYD